MISGENFQVRHDLREIAYTGMVMSEQARTSRQHFLSGTRLPTRDEVRLGFSGLEERVRRDFFCVR